MKKTPIQHFVTAVNTSGVAKVEEYKEPVECESGRGLMCMNVWLGEYAYLDARQIVKIRSGMARKLRLRLNHVTLFVVTYRGSRLMLALYYESSLMRK